jgi:hypothetical protein
VLVAVNVGVLVEVGVVAVNVGVLVAVNVGVGVGVGADPQSLQLLAIKQVVPHSYSPNEAPVGLSTCGKVPPLRQWFLLPPGIMFGSDTVPLQLVTL